MEINIKICDVLLYEKINEYSSIIFEKKLKSVILIFVYMIFFLFKYQLIFLISESISFINLENNI